MNKISYFNFHTHLMWSNLRLLDVVSKPEVLLKRVQECGLGGFALTDHESLSGHIKMIQMQKKLMEEDNPTRIFLGDEIYLVDSLEEVRNNYKPGITQFYHFILVCKDAKGHEQLRKISSEAWSNSFKTGLMERVPIEKKAIEHIIGEDKGHLIFSTACAGSEAAHWVLNNRIDKLKEFISWCQEIALPENFYLEMQPNDSEEQILINQTYEKIGEELGIKRIITTDAHMPSKEYLPIHEAYLNSRQDDSRETMDFYRTCYIMDSDEIHEWMDKQIGAEAVDVALNNTIEIASKIEFFDLAHSQEVPKIPLPEFVQEHSFRNAYDEYEYIKKFAYSENIYDRYFLQCVENGWWEKEYKDDLDSETKRAMISRINDELGAIWESSIKINDNIASYYITAKDIVDMMWNDANSFVGDARGSVAAFYVCYLIGLQQINSFKFNIPYWRHLHESRPEMPDVDIDSEKSKRSAIIEATRNKFGADRVLNICAFKTEGSKSAIQTSCRGMGISVEEAQYISSLIPTIRGKTTSLYVMVNGDEDNKLNTEFINECNKYPGLLDMAMTIEGMICGRTIHASGVIIFARPYTDLNCMMKAPNGQPTTQWDMGDSEYCGGLKYDYLTIVNLDTMHQCMNLMIEYGYIEDQGTIKKTYDKYFSPDVIDYNNPHMWELAEKHEIINLFQFMTQVGMSAIAKIKPRSLTELGVANAIMRLAGEPGKETPLDQYVRYKSDISQWYDCMHSYNLTEEEIKIMEEHLLSVSGCASMQEEVMKLAMDSRITNYSMKSANGLRKLIAKKKVHLQKQAHDEFYEAGRQNGTSNNLLDYIWKECITPQLSYSFSLPHILGYSTIAIQEMNMAAGKNKETGQEYPIILWNCANLITDSMSDEEVEGSTDYCAVGKAIAGMQKRGIRIFNPDINNAGFGFIPDIPNNAIICGLKSLNGIGDDACKTIIQHRPYTSFDDFCTRMLDTKLIKPSQMIMLIKAGCFLKLDNLDRAKTMKKYLSKYHYKPLETLTLSQMAKIEEYQILPENLHLNLKFRNFKNYVLHDDGFVRNVVYEGKKVPKCGYHDRLYVLDANSQPFFTEHMTEDSVVEVSKDGYYIISEKKFTKELDALQQPLREWFTSQEAIDAYNNAMLNSIWNQYASGTESKWSMQALTYYDDKHELDGINCEKYGIVDFFELPEEPVPYDYYPRRIDGEVKHLPKYTISRLVGTVLGTDANHHTVYLLTTTGPVSVKFHKEAYAHYNRKISAPNPDKLGENKIVENSWFQRGTLLAVNGFRQEDQFILRTYSDSIFKHTVNRIIAVKPDGTLELQVERTKV